MLTRLTFIGLSTSIGLVVGAGFGLPAQADDLAPEVVATVSVGAGPWGVAITPDSRRAFIGNSGEAGGGNNVSVIDLESGSVIRQVSTRLGRAAGVAITPNGQFALAASFAEFGTVSRIETGSYTVAESGIVNTNALSIAASPDNQYVYVVCEFGQVWRVNVNDLNLRTSLETPLDGTFDIAVNATQQVYVGGNSTGKVSIVGDSVRFGTLTSVGTAVALSPDGNTAYVGDTGGRFYVFDLTVSNWNSVVATYSLGGDIRGIAVTPDGKQAYVTDRNGNTVRVVDLSNGEILYTIPVGSAPQRVAISAHGRTAVVTNNGEGTVSIISIPAQPASGEPGSVPVAPLQQFIRADGETCDRVPDGFVDFPGISESLRNIGWAPSWAQWVHEGRGGPVCTRQPFFTSTGTWSVR